MTDKQMPKCRYCGGEMILDDWYGESFYYYCKECKSCSPDARTEEEAYEKAMLKVVDDG